MSTRWKDRKAATHPPLSCLSPICIPCLALPVLATTSSLFPDTNRAFIQSRSKSQFQPLSIGRLNVKLAAALKHPFAFDPTPPTGLAITIKCSPPKPQTDVVWPLQQLSLVPPLHSFILGASLQSKCLIWFLLSFLRNLSLPTCFLNLLPQPAHYPRAGFVQYLRINSMLYIYNVLWLFAKWCFPAPSVARCLASGHNLLSQESLFSWWRSPL